MLSRSIHAVAALTAWTLSGCTGSLDDPDRFKLGDDCVGVETKLLGSRCGSVTCHESSKPAAGLDLLSPDPASRLVGIKGEGCFRRQLISPSDPKASFIFEKIEEAPSCGQRMPIGRDALTDQEVRCLTDWVSKVAGGPIIIDDGAVDDGAVDAGTDATAADSAAGGADR